MGEGGAVNIVSNSKLRVIAESFRDWGRSCWCPSGVDNTCNKRFDWSLGDLPHGYDHKYTYSHLGYNLKPLDLQAAIGRQQLKKLSSFIDARKQNWEFFRSSLHKFNNYFEFTKPTHADAYVSSDGTFSWDDSGCQSCCSWFGFMLLIKDSAPLLAQIWHGISIKILSEIVCCLVI